MRKKTKLQKRYLEWLWSIIQPRYPTTAKKVLVERLHEREFRALIPNDRNRAEDGKLLRLRFAQSRGDDEPYSDLDGPATVLEVLIGLAFRLEDIIGDSSIGDQTARWFWEFIENLELELVSEDDRRCVQKENMNEERLDVWIERRYSPSGKGGLFPLTIVTKDQREVELWYQMMNWIDEKYPM